MNIAPRISQCRHYGTDAKW